MNIVEMLAQEMHLKPENVKNVVELIDEGCTIPFIARYRKERTGSMDDQVLRNLGDRLEYLRGLDKRKEEVTGSIEAQNAMTPELQAALAGCGETADRSGGYLPPLSPKAPHAGRYCTGKGFVAAGGIHQGADAGQPEVLGKKLCNG